MVKSKYFIYFCTLKSMIIDAFLIMKVKGTKFVPYVPKKCKKIIGKTIKEKEDDSFKCKYQ